MFSKFVTFHKGAAIVCHRAHGSLRGRGRLAVRPTMASKEYFFGGERTYTNYLDLGQIIIQLGVRYARMLESLVMKERVLWPD